MANGDADQTIKVVIEIDDSQTLKAAANIRNETDRMIVKLQELSIEGKQSLEDVAAGMIKAAEAAKEATKELDALGGKPKLSIEEQIATRAALDEEIALVKKALREATKERTEYFKSQDKLAKESAEIRKQQVKEVSEAEKTALKESQAAQKEYAKITQQGYGVMSAGAKAYGQIIQKTRKVIEESVKRSGKPFQEVAERMRQLGVPAQQINQALKEMRRDGQQAVDVLNKLRNINLAATKVQFEQTRDATVAFLNAMKGINTATQPFNERLRGMVSGLGNLGQVGQFVFGSVLGIGAVQAIRQIIDVFREAIAISLEYQQSLFTLEVAIRGLQRVGLDTTVAGWDDRIRQLKKQFPIFSRKEFTDAASLAALMTREFGFTESQIADLIRQSAILSEITGKDLNEAVRGITFAIGSGYFESLQRAGVNISRQVVANEALAQGYEGVYNELEPVIRAQVTYSVIQKNLNAIQEDAGRIVDTTAGQVKALRAAWEDFRIELGLVITDTEDARSGIEGLAKSLQLLAEFFGLARETDIAGVSFLEIVLGPNYPQFLKTLPEFNKQLEILINKIRELRGEREPILGDFVPEDADALQDFTIGGVQFSEEEYQDILDATNELQEGIIEIEEEANERRLDAIEDYQNDVEDLWEKHKQKLLDLEQKFQDRLDSINVKEGQRVADAIADNEFRVAEVIRKAQFSREDAERKYREKELKEERKFQEKMRQLRENFLLDLEDAVRERDARQIIRLIRQYNLRRDQMTREEKLSKTDREAAFQEELRQIERQKEERLRQLAIEHQRRLDSIALQAQRERDQAKLDWERQQEEEKQRAADAQQERSDRLNEQLNDIREDSQERTNELIKGLQDEYNLTEEQLLAAETLWKQFYGAEGRIAGWVDQGVNYVIARLKQLAQMSNALRTMMGDINDPIRAEKESFQDFSDDIRREKEYSFGGMQAEGGTIIARKPTVAIFGEAGPEMAQFTPLNQLGSQGSGGQMPISGRRSQNGKLALQVLLSPDLEARIIDSALNEVADVVFTIERERA